MRVAGIDCGTNTIRLLIADVDPATQTVRDVVRLMEVVRLGQDVDRTGRLAPEAVKRTVIVTRHYAALCREHEVEKLRFVATSATRDASNRHIFVDGVREAIGVEPEVVPGAEEAALSFAGALTTVRGQAPFLVADLGGGSTELVLGRSTPEAAYSMNIGCVRLTERHLKSDPPVRGEVAAAITDIDQAIDQAQQVVDLGQTRTLVGLAGTVTSLTAYRLGLRRYDPDVVDGTVLSVEDTLSACAEIVAMTKEQRMALGFLKPGRADVLGAGALVWSRVVERVREAVAQTGGRLDTVVTSEHDILDGIVLSVAGC